MTVQSIHDFKTLSVSEVVKNRSRFILEAMREPRDVGAALNVVPIRETGQFITFEARIGDKALIVKAFQLGDPEAPFLLDRELKVCRKLRNTNLTPTLRSYAKAGRMMFFEKTDERSLATMLNEGNAIEIAETLGKWAVKFSRQGMARPVDLSWCDYLARYPEAFPSKDLEKKAKFLDRLPIKHLVLAKNGMALSDFVIRPNLQLIAHNFERCAARPVGWDLVLVAREMDAALPGHLKVIAEALVRGWGPKVGQVGAKHFARLIEQVVTMSRGTGLGRLNGGLDVFADLYAESDPDAETPKAAYRLPMAKGVMEKPTSEQIKDFRATLAARAHDAMAIPEENWLAPEPPAKTKPSKLLGASCATCRGSCCREGLAAHAFLKPAELTWMRLENPEITAEQMVTYYTSFLPEQHEAGSCLFHGDDGCQLPRKARARICNNFLCKAGRFIEQMPEARKNPKDTVLLVARDDGMHDRIAAFDTKTGLQPVDL